MGYVRTFLPVSPLYDRSMQSMLPNPYDCVTHLVRLSCWSGSALWWARCVHYRSCHSTVSNKEKEREREKDSLYHWTCWLTSTGETRKGSWTSNWKQINYLRLLSMCACRKSLPLQCAFDTLCVFQTNGAEFAANGSRCLQCVQLPACYQTPSIGAPTARSVSVLNKVAISEENVFGKEK